MMSIASGTKVYLYAQPVDMRRGFDGLSSLVVQQIQADPYCGHLYVFRSRRGDYLKLLYFDGTGLCLFSKRLERTRFVWPSRVDGTLSLTSAQLTLLLEGLDWRRFHETPLAKRPESV